jgi:transposase
MATMWLGVDVAKTSFVAALVAESGADSEAHLGQFANAPTGFAELAELIASAELEGESVVHLVVERCHSWRGGYELALVVFADAQGWQVSLPNPRQVRNWAKGTGQRAKNDRQDARLLARYGAACQPVAQPPLAAAVSELDSLLKRRQDLEQMLQQENNRLQELHGRPGIASAVEANLARVIAALQDALREVEAAITAHLQQHAHLQAEAQRLLALPGIGPKVVLPLVVLLHRWQTLTAGEGTAKGLTALVGLDPQPYESGRSVRRRSSISKMGNAEARRLLHMGALSAVHGRNPLHVFYERLVGRGKARKLAVVATARKLLTWAWTLFSRQTDWNPALHTI